jgi:two-component system, NarL family, nitrate/nitrite response regulator NarL
MGSAVRIGLVTDQPIFCTGITAALDATDNLAIVAHGQTAEDALRMATDATIDILLLEIAIPGVGTNAVKAICRARPGAKVVVLTEVDDEVSIVDALRLGARGYILKEVTASDLRRALEAVHRGQYYITPTLVSRVLPRLLTRSEKHLVNRDLNSLTSRERQVLSGLCRGLTNQEIAGTLGLSVKTVKQHTTLLFAKLGVRNRVEATAVLHNAEVATVAEARLPH